MMYRKISYTNRSWHLSVGYCFEVNDFISLIFQLQLNLDKNVSCLFVCIQ